MKNKFSEDPKELYEKAENFIDKAEFTKALEYLNKVLEIYPKYAEFVSKLGYVHMNDHTSN